MLGTEWMLYDSKDNPAKMKRGGEVRRELALIHSKQNVVGSAAPRKVQVSAPAIGSDGAPMPHKPTAVADTLGVLTRSGPLDSSRFSTFSNKEPRRNPSSGSYSLDFHGRVTKGSVKNFQLCVDSSSSPVPDAFSLSAGTAPEPPPPPDAQTPQAAAQGPVVFQFGKIGKDEFVLDFAYPLTPLQAFSLGVTTLAFKMANEGG